MSKIRDNFDRHQDNENEIEKKRTKLTSHSKNSRHFYPVILHDTGWMLTESYEAYKDYITENNHWEDYLD